MKIKLLLIVAETLHGFGRKYCKSKKNQTQRPQRNQRVFPRSGCKHFQFPQKLKIDF